MTLNGKKKVLVTGGAGFIGTNLSDRLVREGHEVTIFDDLSRGGADKNLAWLQEQHGSRLAFVKGDVCNIASITAATAGQEVVYHLAAQTAVTTSLTDPRHDFVLNLFGTFNVLEAARSQPFPPALLYASTNKVYGGMEDVLVKEQPTRWVYRDKYRGVDESQPLDFHSPYGCSKGGADQYVRDYARIYGLKTVVFRQSCIYGPHQMGVEDQGWVAWFMIAAVMGKPITIYGDGKQVRDLLYVDDLVDAYEGAINEIETTAGQVYNLGGGQENTISIWKEFQPALSAAVGHSVKAAKTEAARPGDQLVFYCDTRKAERDFGWKPKTNVQNGIPQLGDWVSSNKPLFQEL